MKIKKYIKPTGGIKNRARFIPDDAPMENFGVVGELAWQPIWNAKTNRYDIEISSDLRFNMFKYGYSVLISKGFICDGASVPKRFWDSIGSPYASRYLLAGILHDALYQAELLDRVLCDTIFAEFMTDLGVVWWRMKLMHTAVRMGGGFVWNNHTNVSIKNAEKYVRLVKLTEKLNFPKIDDAIRIQPPNIAPGKIETLNNIAKAALGII